MAQPPTTYIAVAYARTGTAMVARIHQDHALAAKALRLPLGSGGASTSPYLALQDWMKRWPEFPERKSICSFPRASIIFAEALVSLILTWIDD